ncbi:hypothetical protein HHX47_DHR2000880 [Lentinula edodes]|nr:hypothetical protein HHX47_DHR2000880 [Lentinula edodes]
MSVRDLRRNKVDVFLIPSGSLWFSSPAPPGPMFPRGSGVLDDPFNDCTTRIVSITLIRISQNMLFFKRNPSEVQAVHMAGIHHANKDEEREALMVLTAEEKP